MLIKSLMLLSVHLQNDLDQFASTQFFSLRENLDVEKIGVKIIMN